MEMVKDAASRLVTFSKRRNGLFKKANELAILCGAEIAIIVFSPGGKPFSFGHPSVHAITQRFLQDDGGDGGDSDGDGEEGRSEKHRRRRGEKLNKKLASLMEELEKERKKGAILDKDIEEKEKKYGLGPDGPVGPHGPVGPEEGPGCGGRLEGLKRALERVREEVRLRTREMEAASSLLVLSEKLQLKDHEDGEEDDQINNRN